MFERGEIVEVANDLVEGVRETRPMISENLNLLLDIAETAEKRVLAMQKIRRATLKMMSPGDWIDQDGKPYPQSSGLEKVADAWGLSWGFKGKPEKIDLGERYLVKTSLWFRAPWGREIEVEGTRASDDPLYAKRDGELLPMSEVDEGDIRKASYTNALARGISILLGLRNMTWEEINIDPKSVQKIERYSKTEATDEEKKLQNKVREGLTELCSGDARKALQMLTEVTAFTGKDGTAVPGVKSFSALKGRRLEVTYRKVSDMLKIRAQEISDAAEPDGT